MMLNVVAMLDLDWMPVHDEIGYLGLGSNVGDRRVHCRRGRVLWTHALSCWCPRRSTRPSRSARSPISLVLQRLRADRTALGPEPLLDACKAVERTFGRPQAGEDGYVKDGPRAIDVDVLLLGRLVLVGAAHAPAP